MTAALSGAGVRGAIFLRVGTDPLIALWVGFGDIDVPANVLDVAELRYFGLGAVVGIPALQQLLNGVAGRADFSLSGIPPEIAALAESEAADLQGATVNIGYCQMDDEWQLTGDILWLWDGSADVLRITMQAGQDGSQVYTLTLSAGTATTGRARPDFANFTDAQHQRAHPGDVIFNHMPTAEKTKRWPGG